jgi:hypothetical protein
MIIHKLFLIFCFFIFTNSDELLQIEKILKPTVKCKNKLSIRDKIEQRNIRMEQERNNIINENANENQKIEDLYNYINVENLP